MYYSVTKHLALIKEFFVSHWSGRIIKGIKKALESKMKKWKANILL